MFQNPSIIINERLNVVETSFEIIRSALPLAEKLQEIINTAPSRDKVTVFLKNDSDDPVPFTNHQTEPYDYSSVTDGLESEDTIYISIQIDKYVADEKFSIYDYESFTTDFLSHSLLDIAEWFSKRLSEQNSLIFEVFDYDVSFSTRTIAFESSRDVLFKPTVNRIERLNDCKDTAYFFNMNTLKLIPDDFIIQGIVRTDTHLSELFGKLATILSLIYVSSSSSINDNKLQLQINGQRAVNYELLLTDISEDEKWQNIYTWIYTDGNPTDKALIAHNIISLHCKFSAILNLDDTVFDAIRTNYNLYVQKTVEKYLAMKHDIANFIQNVVAQIGDYAVSILSKFKNNLLAIFGFLFTVVLTRIGSTQKWEDIFTRHTIYLIEIFIFGSLAYLAVCLFETWFKFKKTEKGYYALKENYSDILLDAEIKDAFKNDKLLNDTKDATKKGMIMWSLIWGFLLLSTIIIIECLTANHGIIVWFCNKVKQL